MVASAATAATKEMPPSDPRRQTHLDTKGQEWINDQNRQQIASVNQSISVTSFQSKLETPSDDKMESHIRDLRQWFMTGAYQRVKKEVEVWKNQQNAQNSMSLVSDEDRRKQHDEICFLELCTLFALYKCKDIKAENKAEDLLSRHRRAYDIWSKDSKQPDKDRLLFEMNLFPVEYLQAVNYHQNSQPQRAL